MPRQRNNKQPVQKPAHDSISKRFAIISIDLRTRPVTRTRIDIRSHYNGEEVTEEMMKEQVRALNRNCGRHGLTSRILEERKTVFELESRQ